MHVTINRQLPKLVRLLLHQHPIINQQNPIRHRNHHRIMSSNKQTNARLPYNRMQQAGHRLTRLQIQIARWLIGDHKAWLMNEGTRQGYTLLLASGQLQCAMLDTSGQTYYLQRFESTTMAQCWLHCL